MHITVKLSPEAAQALHRNRAGAPTSEEVLRCVQEKGATLEALHPGADNPLLTPYFKVDVPDEKAAQELLGRIKQCKAVQAAYVKPPDAVP